MTAHYQRNSKVVIDYTDAFNDDPQKTIEAQDFIVHVDIASPELTKITMDEKKRSSKKT